MARRVVTVNDPEGRSEVLRSETDGTPFRWGSIIWPLAPREPDSTQLEPGEISWRQYTLPSDEELDAYVTEKYGADAERGTGMHTTPSVDFVQVLEGRVALVLDHETVELGPGDCVVQQSTAHAWKVLEAPVRLTTLMIGLGPGS